MDKGQQDVLRVTQFILHKANNREPFSIEEAAQTTFLNGINRHRIAEIMRSICLEPNGPGTLELYTTVDNSNIHSQQGYWQLTAETYFGYLSYLSVKRAEKANQIALVSISITIVVAFTSILIA
ncbi:MAG: hypothetical protein VX447_11820 [Pseudomonadota bacterium]|uniref:hypothetical protein n=1 Tax=Gallaecimonas pentaromativorans TaxID=584787 RepID=UPI00067E7934|nr:hypothetical protein [Gallaecimonas pentaromativorans]MED5525421.1 hypothetical protein [Pseudomonadota bacterium]